MAGRLAFAAVSLFVLADSACAAPVGTWRFVTEQFAPYTYERAGSGAGPMAEVLRELCQMLQQRCQIEVLPWRRALAMASSGEADGIFTVVDTPERREVFHVALPVIEARYVFYALDGNAFRFKSPGDFEHQAIGVYGPSASSLTLDKLLKGTAASRVLEVDNPTVLRKLRAGRYGRDGLALINEMVARDIIAREKLTGLHVAGEAARFSYTFGLSRKRFDAGDLSRINQGLSSLCRSGRLQALLDPYGMRAAACRN